MQILDAWLRDIPQEFLGKKNIEVLITAFARQLQEIEAVFFDIDEKTDLKTATGKNLDMIGTIIPLTRKEAGIMAGANNPEYVISDDRYRQFLKYKLLVNTNECTYYDIMEAVRMFWSGPVRYTEPVDEPASFRLDAYVETPDQKADDLLRIPTIRPSGVGVGITVHLPLVSDELYIGGKMASVAKIVIPSIADVFTFDETLHLGGKATQLIQNPIPLIMDDVSFLHTLRTGGRAGSVLSQPVPVIRDKLLFDDILRTGGMMARFANAPVAQGQNNIVFQRVIGIGGQMALINSLFVPLTEVEILWPYVLKRSENLGGRLSMIGGIAIPPAPDIIVCPCELTSVVRIGSLLDQISEIPIPVSNTLSFKQVLRIGTSVESSTSLFVPQGPEVYNFEQMIATGRIGGLVENIAKLPIAITDDRTVMDLIENELRVGGLMETQTGIVIPSEINSTITHNERGSGQPTRSVTLAVPEITS